MARHLACPNGCPGGRFELLGGHVTVDAEGRCLGHGDRTATFACELCGSVAVDLSQVARELREPPLASVEELVCPACGARLLAPDDPEPGQLQCPDCEALFFAEEGRFNVLGGTPAEEGDGPDDRA